MAAALEQEVALAKRTGVRKSSLCAAAMARRAALVDGRSSVVTGRVYLGQSSSSRRAPRMARGLGRASAGTARYPSATIPGAWLRVRLLPERREPRQVGQPVQPVQAPIRTRPIASMTTSSGSNRPADEPHVWTSPHVASRRASRTRSRAALPVRVRLGDRLPCGTGLALLLARSARVLANAPDRRDCSATDG